MESTTGNLPRVVSIAKRSFFRAGASSYHLRFPSQTAGLAMMYFSQPGEGDNSSLFPGFQQDLTG